MNLKELQEKYRGLIAKSEAIRLKYQGKSDGMTSTEQEEWTNILTEADGVKSLIEATQKADALRDFEGKAANPLQTGADAEKDDKGVEQDKRKEMTAAERGKKAFVKFLSGGARSLTSDDLQDIALSTSTKAYQADNPAGGGYLVSPQMFVQDLITLIKDQVFIAGMATNYTCDRAESLGIPALDVDPTDAVWTTELSTGAEEDTMAFGKRELFPHPAAKRVLLSNKLLRQSTMDPEGIVRDRLAYKFGVTLEQAYLTGSGSNQPLGVFTPSTQGIPTSRDVPTAVTATLGADDLIATLYNLKGAYQAKATWLLHRTIMQAVRLLKDQNKNYLWSTGLGPGTGYSGQPETLLNRPYAMSEYAPNGTTSGSYQAIIGDFSRYVIATALDMEIMVLDQLYAENNQTGFIARLEVDGMPVLSEAFSRCVLS